MLVPIFYKTSYLFLLCTYLCMLPVERINIGFFATLQIAISSLSQRDCFVMLVDFNARVRSRQDDDDDDDNEWWYERAPMGKEY